MADLQLQHENHSGLSHEAVDGELRFTVSGTTSLTTANLLTTPGAIVKLVYRSTGSRWELPDGTVPTLTGREASIIWEGTSAQIPAQGTGDSEFQEGDQASVRSTSL